jgi:hypothetical protein
MYLLKIHKKTAEPVGIDVLWGKVITKVGMIFDYTFPY